MGGFVQDAFPYLVAYLGSEDPGHRLAAWVALNKLTNLGLWSRNPRTQSDGQALQKEFMRLLDIKQVPSIP
jgi:hypothetical protein